MLALGTGWTPDVLGELPSTFRAACHWALYARAIVGDEGLEQIEIPRNAPDETRLAAMRRSVFLNGLRTELYPADDDG